MVMLDGSVVTELTRRKFVRTGMGGRFGSQQPVVFLLLYVCTAYLLLRCNSVLQALIVTSVDYPRLVCLRACIYYHLLAR